MARTTIQPMDRILFIGQTDGCHTFSGSRDKDGYYRFWLNENAFHARAHRVAYADRHGSIPDGLVVDHLCRNRGCVNPNHLDICPPDENYRRGNRPRTSPLFVPKSHCKQGHPRSGDNLGGPTPSGQYYCKACLAARNATNNAKRAEARRILREGNG